MSTRHEDGTQDKSNRPSAETRITTEAANAFGEPPVHVAPLNMAENDFKAFGQSEIAALAHELWEALDDPQGCLSEDWFRAVQNFVSDCDVTEVIPPDCQDASDLSVVAPRPAADGMRSFRPNTVN